MDLKYVKYDEISELPALGSGAEAAVVGSGCPSDVRPMFEFAQSKGWATINMKKDEHTLRTYEPRSTLVAFFHPDDDQLVMFYVEENREGWKSETGVHIDALRFSGALSLLRHQRFQES